MRRRGAGGEGPVAPRYGLLFTRPRWITA